MSFAVAYDRVSKSFAGIPAVRDVSFTARSGRVLGLVGENGAGKSTLMNLLGGLFLPDGGRLQLAGERYEPRSPLEAVRRGVAFIHQELSLFSNLTIAQNIFLTGALDRPRATELLASVGLSLSPDTPVAALSPGERQLVEIAKALSIDARVLIFDEPTTSLTAPERERLFALIDRLRGEGRALIYISHALPDVLRICDDVVVLRDGMVVESGPREAFTHDRLITAMVGRALGEPAPRPGACRGDLLLEVALEGIAFGLHRGEVLGVAGLMGSGRTELARMLFGLDRARGEIRLQGRSLRGLSPRARIARGMAFLTESRRDDGLLLDASVRENATLAAPLTSTEAVATACASVRLPAPMLDRDAVRTLSGGNQQKVVLAKWLLTRPSVLILDEPTRGIDVAAKREIGRVIDELVTGGAGVLLISSELEELMALSDRLMVMRQGRIVGEVHRAAFDSEAILRLALGDAS